MNQVEKIKMESKTETKPSTNAVSPMPPTGVVILVNEADDNQTEDKRNRDNKSMRKVNYANGLLLFSALGACILSCSPFVLIPHHDAIRFPEYWYEILITFSLTYPIQWTLLAMLDNHFLLKVEALKSFNAGLAMVFTPIFVCVMIYCSLYIYWTYKLDYNFPMPLGNLISLNLFFPFIMTFWFLVPKDLRTQKNSWRRLAYFVLYTLWLYWAIGLMLYHSFVPLLEKLPTNAQPMNAIFLPLIRLFEAMVVKKLLSKCVPSDEIILASYTEIISNVNFLIYVTITISTKSTDTTAFCILLVDVIGNLYQCYTIIKLQRKQGFDELELKRRQEEKAQKVKMLALSEILDILIPLSYTMTYIVAYYGPNAMILNKVRRNYWKKEEDKNIEKLLAAELKLFSVDFASFVFTAATLGYFCKINFVKQMCKSLRKYWLLIAAVAGSVISRVSFIDERQRQYIHDYNQKICMVLIYTMISSF